MASCTRSDSTDTEKDTDKTSATQRPTDVVSYPLEAPVLLHGLVNAAALNGSRGVVKSTLQDNGRQRVYVEASDQSVGLKPLNLRWQGRTVSSLSVRELKAVLHAGGDSGDVVPTLQGLDKAELRSRVAARTADPEELAALLHGINIKGESGRGGGAGPPAKAATTPQQQQQQQALEMSPEQLRQQARMMLSTDPDTLRRMNPQLATMSNVQIRQAADRMDMLANNPTMMQAARQQMGVNGMMVPPTTAAPPQDPRDMTPAQMRQQAELLRSMEPDMLRRMNPQMANLTDAQIKMAASQFDMMASNPAMFQMAMDQVGKLSPAQLQAAKNGTLSPDDMAKNTNNNTNNTLSMDPAKMLEGMDRTQLRQLLTSLQDNPEMMDQLTAGLGNNGGKSSMVSGEQFKKGVEMFAALDDTKLDQALHVLKKVQSAHGMWTRADAQVGGHLKKILLLVNLTVLVLMVLAVRWLFVGNDAALFDFTAWARNMLSFGSSGSSISSGNDNMVPTTISVEDEFADDGEF